jgi:hypothetical protein
MRRAIVAFCAFAYLLLTTGLANAAQGVCNCDDMAQIQRRIDETKAAIGKYADLFLATPEYALNTDAAHDKVQAAVGNAITNTPGLERFFTTVSPSYTDVRCAIHYDEPTTACIHDALVVHENVHKTACDQRTFRHPWIFLRDFIKEEETAYTAELDFLRGEKGRLLCNCPYYALKVNAAGANSIMLPYETIAGQYQVSGVKKPEVEIPLKFGQGGSVKGEADVLLSGNEIASGAVPCGITSGEPMTVVVDGQLTPAPLHKSTLQVDLSRKPTRQTNTGGCAAPPPLGYVSVNGTVNNPNSPHFPFTITALDSPDTRSVPFAPGIAWTFSTEMSIAEPWPSTKASNGRGSTVGDALIYIGMPDCTQ